MTEKDTVRYWGCVLLVSIATNHFNCNLFCLISLKCSNRTLFQQFFGWWLYLAILYWNQLFCRLDWLIFFFFLLYRVKLFLVDLVEKIVDCWWACKAGVFAGDFLLASAVKTLYEIFSACLSKVHLHRRLTIEQSFQPKTGDRVCSWKASIKSTVST